MVEHIQESSMQRQSGTENSGNHHLVIGCADRRHPQGSLYLLDRIRQFLTHFIRHYLSNAFNITAETHTVALDCYITNFRHVLVQDRICLGKVDNLHNYKCANVQIC